MRELFGADPDPGRERKHRQTGEDEQPHQIAMRELKIDRDRNRRVQGPVRGALHVREFTLAARTCSRHCTGEKD